MLTKEDRARILELHAADAGATEIARKLGISRSTVHRILREEVRAPVDDPGPDADAAEGRSDAAASPLRESMRRAELRAALEIMSEIVSDEDGFGASSAHRAFEAALDACLGEVGGAGLPDLEEAVDELGARFRALALGDHPHEAADQWTRLVQKMQDFERKAGLPLRRLEPVLSANPSRLGEVLAALDEVDTLRRDAEKARGRRDGFAKEASFFVSAIGRAHSELQAMQARKAALWQEIGWLEWRWAHGQQLAASDRTKGSGASMARAGPNPSAGMMPRRSLPWSSDSETRNAE